MLGAAHSSVVWDPGNAETRPEAMGLTVYSGDWWAQWSNIGHGAAQSSPADRRARGFAPGGRSMSNERRPLDLEMRSQQPAQRRLPRASVGPLEITVAGIAVVVVGILLLNGTGSATENERVSSAPERSDSDSTGAEAVVDATGQLTYGPDAAAPRYLEAVYCDGAEATIRKSQAICRTADGTTYGAILFAHDQQLAADYFVTTGVERYGSDFTEVERVELDRGLVVITRHAPR